MPPKRTRLDSIDICTIHAKTCLVEAILLRINRLMAAALLNCEMPCEGLGAVRAIRKIIERDPRHLKEEENDIPRQIDVEISA